MSVTLMVFFDEPFWVGLFERREGGRLSAAKVVFGAEPKDEQVLAFILCQYDRLSFSPPVAGVGERPLAANPKRRQRQAAEAQTRAPSTKSQQALKLAQEENKLERRERSKAQREAEAAYKLQLHIEKKKAKHRGR